MEDFSWEKIDGETILSAPWYSYRENIKSVVISEGIRTIGGRAFSFCESLSSVSIPNSVTSIGYRAFWHCESLTSVTIPNSVTSIGEDAFYFCKSLTSVTIPNSVTSIGSSAFAHTSLTSVTIPNSVTSIGNTAFYYCDSLTSVFIPDSVKEIGYTVFHYNYSGYKTLPNVTVYGYAGSYAETWCKNHTYKGVALPVPFVAVTSVPSWAQGSNTSTPTVTTPTYTITPSTSSNGTVKVNQSSAQEGDRVTLTVSPSSGYMVDSVIVKDASGNSITCGYDWVDGVYAFIMPSGNVTITVNYSKIPTVTYSPTVVTTSGQGKYSVSVAKPSAGDIVKVTVTPDSGYAVSGVIVKDSSGNDVLCVKVSDGVYQYTQPSGNVTIYVTYYYVKNTVETYTDINYADWYAAYASYAIDNGLMSGTSVGVFDPNIPVSRAMVALILANVSGEKIPTTTGSEFSDVSSGQWYSNAIAWCKSKNIVAGYDDGRFGVNDAITREQMVTILRSFASYTGYDTNVYNAERLFAYTDSTDVSSYAIVPFQWAIGLNYIQGTGNTISPKDHATRAEFANILNYFIVNN